jgi:hypothetical protein
MSDIFGNDNNGFWVCENDGHPDRYYVLPLRAAVHRNALNKKPRHYEYWTPYETIAKAKYPWKCPRCSNAMKYKDLREETIYTHIGFNA